MFISQTKQPESLVKVQVKMDVSMFYKHSKLKY